ncbi:P-loop containing nucleoside triphosphate hydrolase protein [Coprinopsis sp. MPI-PUGE-AT-0042]|nr:P-loop containing nucleoside triphosphate hydrolase protein [Coprinopsis sp. MPI-PUGE-AT-0042]
MSRFSFGRRQSSSNNNTNNSHRRTDSSASGSAPTPSSPTGTQDLSHSDYSERARRLIELTNDLKDLGANHILDIPRVVFIGNQSAGKSSVVEGVTGIKVPRDGGTCTRCPMECTVTRKDGPWTCNVRLRLDYENGVPLEGTPTFINFAKVKNPADVELWLRRAQAAILSPSQPLTEALAKPFRTKNSDELKKMQKDGELLPFSFNTVEIEISDRDGTDLSFVDLPGIIHNHESDPNMTSVVMQLVERNIKGKNTLIVVTLPMTDDIQTQKAVEIARRADPKGYRTIGVATKPDTLSAGDLGSLEAWKETLQGKVHTLRHGYFAVKLPNEAARAAGHTRTELQQLEMSFFNSTDPWKGLADRSRFGIPNFVKSTSKLLVNLIERNLPSLKREVDALLASALEEQSALPPLLDANLPPLHIVLSRVTNFCKIFEQTVEGSINKSFTRANIARYQAFKRGVDTTFPKFCVTWERQNNQSITMGDVRKEIEEHTSWEFPGYVPFEATKVFILRHISCWEEPANDCFAGVSSNLSNFINRLLSEPDQFERFAVLKEWIWDIISTEEAACVGEASAMIKKLFTFDNSSPLYFQNRQAFDAARNAWFASYGLQPHKSGRVDEHEVMANIYAYLQIASQRFIDQVPLAIVNMLHQALAARLGDKLMKAVIEMDPNDLKDMLKEDPEIAETRERLRQRVEKPKAIKERLLEFERGSTYNPAEIEEEPQEIIQEDHAASQESYHPEWVSVSQVQPPTAFYAVDAPRSVPRR